MNRTVSRGTAAIQALCAQGLSAETLVPAVLEALHRVVPSSRNLFDWTDAQGRLLRLLEERRYRAIGEERERTADVRFIVGTNADLEGAVAQGRVLRRVPQPPRGRGHARV